MPDAIIKPFGPCLVETSVEEDKVEKIKEFCEKNKNLNIRDKLAGHLDHEYEINATKLQEIIQFNVDQYKVILNHYYGYNEQRNLTISAAWVNYMQSGDFNPLHTHSDCNFSGVIYLSVPKELEKEAEASVAKGIKPGQIEFTVGTKVPNYITSHQFFPKKGSLYIFPHNILHMVCPFKSNVERVSVAFNLIWSNE